MMNFSSLCAFEDEPGVVPASAARMDSTDTSVLSEKVEVQSLSATAIVVIGSWPPHCHRSRDAWANDFKGLLVRRDVLHPGKGIIKQDTVPSRTGADAIESIPGHLVQRSRRSTCCFCILNSNNILRP